MAYDFDANAFVLHLLQTSRCKPSFCPVDTLSGAYAWAKFQTQYGLLCVVVKGNVLVHLGFDAQSFPASFGENISMAEDIARATQCLKALYHQLRQQQTVTLAVKATPFQQSVWRALCALDVGEVGTYSQLAVAIGRPRAVRAVASAIGANPFALLIPCHRVCRADGGLGGYRWGVALKRQLLAIEQELKG